MCVLFIAYRQNTEYVRVISEFYKLQYILAEREPPREYIPHSIHYLLLWCLFMSRCEIGAN